MADNLSVVDVFLDKTLDDGSVQSFVAQMPAVKPKGSDFSWANQGPATVSGSPGGSVLLTDPAGPFGGLRMQVKPVPTAPYKVTANFLPDCVQPVNAFGLVLRDSVSGKIVSYLYQAEFVGSVIVFKAYLAKWNDPVTYVGSYGSPIVWPGNPPPYMQVQDDGTNRTFAYSMDGVNFHPFPSVADTDFIVPDQVGYFVYSQNPDNYATVKLLSWKEE